ncbi:MAG: RNA pyrophosphohydrolase [Pseudomonadota bacterium]
MSQEKFIEKFRPNVGVALFNKSGQVWFGRRVDPARPVDVQSLDWYDGSWQMPQGGIDAGEDIAAAAARELKEETGVSSVQLLLVTPGWVAYNFPPGYKRKNWRGQRQKWAAMLFLGNDDEIDLAADDHQEFDAWRWGELEEAPEIIVDFKNDVYKELVTSLRPLRDFIRSLATD